MFSVNSMSKDFIHKARGVSELKCQKSVNHKVSAKSPDRRNADKT